MKFQYNRGLDFDASKILIEAWATHWLEFYKDPTVGASVRKTTRSLIRTHIIPHIGHLKISEVKTYQLQEIMNRQIGKSKSNTLKILGIIHQLFQKAYRDGLITVDPSEGLEMPKTVTKERRALTDIERNNLSTVCETYRAGLWVMLMLMCGLRRGETVPLRWNDIDFDKNVLTVNKAVEFINNNANEKTTKTKPVSESFRYHRRY